MKIVVRLDDGSQITAYATVGSVDGGQTLDIPDDTDLSILSHAKWDGSSLIELPIEDLPTPGPSELDHLREQVAAQQRVIDALLGVAE